MTATATATRPLTGTTFAAYAISMNNRFRGFATIEAATVIADGKIKGGKGSGYSGRITKTTKTQVVLNPRSEGYADAVNKRRAIEHGDKPIETLEHFEAKPRSWGVHVPNSSFIEHKGKLYLEVRVLRSLETAY